MAGDWIKFEHVTPDKPEVDQIANILGIDPDAVVGKLIRFWIWADQQAISGNALTVTKTLIDRITYASGFADALLKVGWLQARSGSFAIPHFDRHNGQTAKSRAITNRRVSNHRNRCNADSVTDVTPPPLQKALPEKRREESLLRESKEPPPPASPRKLPPPPDLHDTHPRAVAENIERIQRWINAMNPGWRPHYTRAEQDELMGSMRFLDDLTDLDWRKLRAFMHAEIPVDWHKPIRFWQPDNRGQFIRQISDVLGHSDRFHARCRKERVAVDLGKEVAE